MPDQNKTPSQAVLRLRGRLNFCCASECACGGRGTGYAHPRFHCYFTPELCEVRFPHVTHILRKEQWGIRNGDRAIRANAQVNFLG